MTEEEKQLLLKDICAYLPYRVIAHASEINKNGIITDVNIPYSMVNLTVDNDSGNYELVPLFDIKPYLRKMSSMTEEEKEEFRKLSDEVVGSYGPYHREFIAHCVRLGIKPGNPHECIDEYVDMGAIDWLNSHHFDYRGLIEKGLALEAPEGTYK